jgi:hypothetical protein
MSDHDHDHNRVPLNSPLNDVSKNQQRVPMTFTVAQWEIIQAALKDSLVMLEQELDTQGMMMDFQERAVHEDERAQLQILSASIGAVIGVH